MASIINSYSCRLFCILTSWSICHSAFYFNTCLTFVAICGRFVEHLGQTWVAHQCDQILKKALLIFSRQKQLLNLRLWSTKSTTPPLGKPECGLFRDSTVRLGSSLAHNHLTRMENDSFDKKLISAIMANWQ
jgi:hypothetical protein